MNAKVNVENIYLETPRLTLRPWKQSDVHDFYEYAKVDGVGQMAGWNPHTSIEESKEILAQFIHNKNQFAIELKENHKVIGSVGLENLSIELDDSSTELTGREIGYVLSKEYWGRGLMPEAVKRVITYCFEELDYNFLQCSHEITNTQSKRVIEKTGFSYVKDHARSLIDGTTRTASYYVLKNPNQTITI